MFRQPVVVKQYEDGNLVASAQGINIISGTGISVSAVDNPSERRVDYTITLTGAGSGDVVGPGSATDNALVRFDGTTGKLIQNSGATLDDSGNLVAASFAPSSGGAFRTAQGLGNTALIQAYDVDGAAFVTFATLTAANTPTMDLSTAVTIGGSAILSAAAIGVSVQAFDATLTSIAALGTAADRIAYTTNVDTWAETPLTSFGRSLIDDADATAARSTLGLVIGTNVQAWDADLDTWATKTAPSGDPVGTTDSQSLTNKTIAIVDTNFTILGSGDATRIARFEVDGITAGNTRVFTFPDLSDTLVTLTATQTLTNKTATSLVVNGTSSLTITQTVATSGTPFALRITGAAHTTLTAATEMIDLDINLARTVQFSTGAITTQRAVYIQAPTYAFVGASVITNAATVFISGAPAQGTNCTITNSYALYSNGATFVNGALTANSTLTVNGLATLTAGLTVSGSANITISTSGNMNFGAAFGTLVFDSGTPHIQGGGTSVTLQIEGSRIAGSTNDDVQISTQNTRTAGSILALLNNTTERVRFEYTGGITVSQGAAASGTRALLTLTGAAHTAQTASTELNDVYFNLARTIQFSTGAIATQRAFRVAAPTYSFVASSTITDAATVYISGSPVAGTNATITNSYALWVDSGTSRFDGRVLNAQGADVASAGDLTLGSDGNVFEITGTTTINAITTTGWQNGTRITLLFTSTPTVKHNTAGGAGTAVMLLAGAVDFSATAGDTLSLVLSEIGGTQAWREVGRAVI